MAATLVIFGASGDLTSRKLIPALYRLHLKGRLPSPTRIVGVSRTNFSNEEFRGNLAKTTEKFCGSEFRTESWEEFSQSITYCPGDIQKPEDFRRLAEYLTDTEDNAASDRIYYLSTLPKLYGAAADNLGAAGLADEAKGNRRIIVEKPFGVDLKSAQQLNRDLHRVFDERQIYRIDHYLGKETVQNLLVLRFGNSIFEPIWNRNYIDHVQITVAEEVAVGRRGGYYDHSGVLRDMFQNHLLQLLMITAMEAPVRYQADLTRDEKVKVLRAVRPLADEDFARDTLRGQYAGYLDEEGVADDSQTATFAALKFWIDNWRWNGVPFYLRSGKGMSCRTTQIVIQFRQPPHMLFADGSNEWLDGNRLVIQVQPAEGIQLHIQTKVPDSDMKLRTTDLDFNFQREFAGELPDAYQRLLLDAIEGDASLFARSDEVEVAWQIIDPILEAWDRGLGPDVHAYPLGEWGPQQSTAWMHDQGRTWFDVCPVLSR